MLVILASVVVLARIVVRRSNRRVNVVAGALMAVGVCWSVGLNGDPPWRGAQNIERHVRRGPLDIYTYAIGQVLKNVRDPLAARRTC